MSRTAWLVEATATADLTNADDDGPGDAGTSLVVGGGTDFITNFTSVNNTLYKQILQFEKESGE